MKIILIANCIKNFEYFTSFQAFDLNAFRSLKFVQIYYQIKCKIEIDSGKLISQKSQIRGQLTLCPR